MRDDRAHPLPVVVDVGTYTEARAVKQELRCLGIPASEIELRVVGLRFVSPVDSFLVAAVFGLIAFTAGPLLGFVFTRTLITASTQVVAGSVALCTVCILGLSWWLVRQFGRRGGVGFAVPERIDVAVAWAYARDARRILAADPS